MRLSYDQANGFIYAQVVDEIPDGAAVRQATVNAQVIIDYAADGTVLGFEIMLPEIS